MEDLWENYERFGMCWSKILFIDFQGTFNEQVYNIVKLMGHATFS